MSFRPRVIVGAILVALALAAADVYVSRDGVSLLPAVPSEKRVELTLANTQLSAVVADTPALRTQGLSGRVKLKENEGMLFLFEEPAQYPFWMKDMLFPIDMIWFDADRKVVDITKDATPSSYPELFSPKVKAQYVLEVLSGWAGRHKLKEGDQLLFPGEITH